MCRGDGTKLLTVEPWVKGRRQGTRMPYNQDGSIRKKFPTLANYQQHLRTKLKRNIPSDESSSQASAIAATTELYISSPIREVYLKGSGMIFKGNPKKNQRKFRFSKRTVNNQIMTSRMTMTAKQMVLRTIKSWDFRIHPLQSLPDFPCRIISLQ